jgi:hypothetical protein
VDRPVDVVHPLHGVAGLAENIGRVLRATGTVIGHLRQHSWTTDADEKRPPSRSPSTRSARR